MTLLLIAAAALGLLVFAVLAGWGIVTYNGLVRLRVGGDTAWSDIDVQLKKRHDLVPTLVEVVKGYAAHERDTLERVVKARQQVAGLTDRGRQIEGETVLSQALRQLFAVSEAYPDLKANQSFLRLQQDLSQIEEDLSNARRYYNAVVRDFNTRQELFPASLVAQALGFAPRPFFEIEAEDRAAPRVNLS